MRRSATILGLLAMLALTACGRVGFDRGAFTDAVAGSCVATSPSDDFEVSELPACASWGSTSTNGLDLARVAGALAITPSPSPAMAGDFGGCTVVDYDLDRDAFVEVSAILDDFEAYTNLSFYYDSSVAVIQVAGADQAIFAIVDGNHMGERPYDPIAMRFWRLHVENARLLYQVSPDARSWTDLASDDVSGADLTGGNLTFGAGRDGPAATGTARFESFNQCP